MCERRKMFPLDVHFLATRRENLAGFAKVKSVRLCSPHFTAFPIFAICQPAKWRRLQRQLSAQILCYFRPKWFLIVIQLLCAFSSSLLNPLLLLHSKIIDVYLHLMLRDQVTSLLHRLKAPTSFSFLSNNLSISAAAARNALQPLLICSIFLWLCEAFGNCRVHRGQYFGHCRCQARVDLARTLPWPNGRQNGPKRIKHEARQ